MRTKSSYSRAQQFFELGTTTSQQPNLESKTRWVYRNTEDGHLEPTAAGFSGRTPPLLLMPNNWFLGGISRSVVRKVAESTRAPACPEGRPLTGSADPLV